MEDDSRSREAAPCVVVGAGPAGLMAAETIARAGRRVVVHDASPSPARKFLLAGRGGLNLTHSEPLETFHDPLRRGGRAPASGDRGLPASRPCATGRPSSAKRPSSARAGASSQRASRRRRSCAPGSGGSATSMSRSGHDLASSASTRTAHFASRVPRARRRVRAGRGGVRARRRIVAEARRGRRLGRGLPRCRNRGRRP